MAKFSGATKTAPARGPLGTTGPAPTHEGGAGFAKDPKTELFTLAVANMVGETSFYESADQRDGRFVTLVRQVAIDDPTWMQAFIPWLRNEANMRSASVVAGVEYALAGGPNGRQVLASACQRADEPAEALGYYLATYGRTVATAVKRGVADAAKRIYRQHNALKYDGGSRGVRMGDVLELTHPTPYSTGQSALFKHLLDRRHGHFDGDLAALKEAGLQVIANAYTIDSIPADQRRQYLRDHGPDVLAEAGYTWERLSGWLPGGMDAEAWEAIIPSMGYMALLRNLRNFEDARVSALVLRQVQDILEDPERVAKSFQFPYRFWSAYKNSGTMLFGPSLERALEQSVGNIPALAGRTLVAVDTSASMRTPVSNRSKVLACEVGAVFAASVGARSSVDLMIYADRGRMLRDRPNSVLRTVELIRSLIGAEGHGTNTWPSVLTHYRAHDRIVVFTDQQDHPAAVGANRSPYYGQSAVPMKLPDVPVYVWDLNGYRTANMDLSQPNRYMLGGFSDAAFRLMNLLEAGQKAKWPWEND